MTPTVAAMAIPQTKAVSLVDIVRIPVAPSFDQPAQNLKSAGITGLKPNSTALGGLSTSSWRLCPAPREMPDPETHSLIDNFPPGHTVFEFREERIPFIFAANYTQK